MKKLQLRRYTIFALLVVATVTSVWAVFRVPGIVPLTVILAALTCLGIWDLYQARHAVTRNYPVIGHIRYLIEWFRPEIRQYLIEGDHDNRPFSRDRRAIVYQRAKDVEDKRPFGTRLDVYESGYCWLNHSMQPVHLDKWDFRVKIGGADCRQPYDASIYNISGMSFGALSANAVLALNQGARQGGFAHCTGEGGLSRFHLKNGGDLVYQIGTAYNGCRTQEGQFDPEKFAQQANLSQIKMIEVKLSQGAKPGHGGVLPAAKLTAEIANARGVPEGVDHVAPPAHSAFSGPRELLHFIRQLRELSGGKPVGCKLCVGHRREFMCLVKAMLDTGITPDFIVVDGKEGGTGAAPLEFSNHIGMPLNDGLYFVHNTLRGAGLRDRIRLGASGKIITGVDLARVFTLGADWANCARGFMFAIGCIQAQACHTNQCPVGVATQDPLRQRALHVEDKARRTANFHRNTLKAFSEMIGAAGLSGPHQLRPEHFMWRLRTGETVSGRTAYPWIKEGCLLQGDDGGAGFLERWDRASAEAFSYQDVLRRGPPAGDEQAAYNNFSNENG